MLPYKINFNQVALIIVDLQKGYCDPESDCAQRPLDWDVSAADEICKLHVPFLEAVRKVLPPENIIWTQMEEHPDTYAENSPAKYDSDFVNLCVRGTPGHDFHVVAPIKDEAVLFKTHPSAFYEEARIITPSNKGMDLNAYLKELDIETTVLTGVIESRCVHATISGASERRFHPLALRDLIGHPRNKSNSSFETEASVIRDLEDRFTAWGMSSKEFLQLAP